jgi:hypothetical protein
MNILKHENLLDIICCFSFHVTGDLDWLSVRGLSVTVGDVFPPLHPKLKVDTVFGKLWYSKPSMINGVSSIGQAHCSISLSYSFNVALYQILYCSECFGVVRSNRKLKNVNGRSWKSECMAIGDASLRVFLSERDLKSGTHLVMKQDLQNQRRLAVRSRVVVTKGENLKMHVRGAR